MFRNLTVTYQQEAEALPQSQTINSAPTNKMTKWQLGLKGIVIKGSVKCYVLVD